ncbi:MULTISPECIES: NUDIX hydrolase [unclassified Streptomyces]|uniref:NUDIX hydrolase n=1 Tax=unclassified Streptomyces TaxID=2593676 RepID=UPI0036CFA865
MAIPEFIRDLRTDIGTKLLWLPGVSAVVFDDAGRVLLGKRADTGGWSVIGGIPEPGEQPAETAVREVYEETAVHVVPEGVVLVETMPPTHYPNGDVCQFMDVTLRCRAVGGTARVNDDESLEVGWFPVDALPALDDYALSRIKKALEAGPTWFQGMAEAEPDTAG